MVWWAACSQFRTPPRVSSPESGGASTSRQHYTSAALAASPQTSGLQDIHPCLSFVGWHRSCVPSWRWLPPLAAVFCCLLTIEHAWSRDHTTSSVTAVFPSPGQRCGTVCLNSFGNRTSPSDNSNDLWKRLCLVSCAATPCVWTSRALTRNLLTYLLTYPPII